MKIERAYVGSRQSTEHSYRYIDIDHPTLPSIEPRSYCSTVKDLN